MSSENGSTFYKVSFWIMLLVLAVLIYISFEGWFPKEEVPKEQNMIPISLMIQAKNGWIILSDVEAVSNSTTIKGKVIYVTTKVDEHPSCLGCHSRDIRDQRRVEKDTTCPAWVIQLK